MAKIQNKRMRGISIKLTDEQKEAIQKFWNQTPSGDSEVAAESG